MKERHALVWIETDTKGEHYVLCHTGDDSTVIGRACNHAKQALPRVRWDTLYHVTPRMLDSMPRPAEDDYRNRTGQAAVELAIRAFAFYPG